MSLIIEAASSEVSSCHQQRSQLFKLKLYPKSYIDMYYEVSFLKTANKIVQLSHVAMND